MWAVDGVRSWGAKVEDEGLEQTGVVGTRRFNKTVGNNK